jgi:hypothetical protein
MKFKIGDKVKHIYYLNNLYVVMDIDYIDEYWPYKIKLIYTDKNCRFTSPGKFRTSEQYLKFDTRQIKLRLLQNA